MYFVVKKYTGHHSLLKIFWPKTAFTFLEMFDVVIFILVFIEGLFSPFWAADINRIISKTLFSQPQFGDVTEFLFFLFLHFSSHGTYFHFINISFFVLLLLEGSISSSTTPFFACWSGCSENCEGNPQGTLGFCDLGQNFLRLCCLEISPNFYIFQYLIFFVFFLCYIGKPT